MASVNKVILVGNVGRDPEIRYLPSGDAVANLNLATTDKFKDRNGDQQEVTEWHRISFFGRQAEICGQYVKKGSQIYVEGSLRTRKWQDKDGNDRYTTEIRGDRMQMLGGGGRGEGGHQEEGHRTNHPASGRTDYARASGRDAEKSGGTPGFADMHDDDIPF